MSGLEEHRVGCPYCGEVIDVLLDCSLPYQSYTEDCQVCCRPIVLSVTVEGDTVVSVEVATEQD